MDQLRRVVHNQWSRFYVTAFMGMQLATVKYLEKKKLSDHKSDSSKIASRGRILVIFTEISLISLIDARWVSKYLFPTYNAFCKTKYQLLVKDF